jgi:hypothetical protein
MLTHDLSHSLSLAHTRKEANDLAQGRCEPLLSHASDRPVRARERLERQACEQRGIVRGGELAQDNEWASSPCVFGALKKGVIHVSKQRLLERATHLAWKSKCARSHGLHESHRTLSRVARRVLSFMSAHTHTHTHTHTRG